MSSNDRTGPKGLKRLSLTPGARALPLLHTPTSSITTEFSLPTPIGSNTRRHTPKRTFSISYYNSAHIVASPTSSSSDTFVRSPVPPTIHESAPAPALLDINNGLRRAASLPKRGHTALSIDNTIETPPEIVIPAQTPTPTPPPQTLAEKHADLLSFIAKKESKCMELREQLAQQEAELASLKRKWERIVSRAANNIPDTAGTSYDTSPSPDTRSKPLPGSSGSEAVSDVVGAIRDGVTGFGRMLVMGGLGAPLTPSSQPASPAFLPTPVQPTRSPSIQSPTFGPSSRSSSVSSITITSPPGSTTSTGRTSLSSVTSLASEDADQDDVLADGLLPNGSNSQILGVQTNGQEPSPSTPSTASLVSSEVHRDKPSAQPLKLRDRATKTLSLGPSMPSPRGTVNLADRLAEKIASARLTSSPPSSPSGSWVPTSLNKRLEGLQKSEAITKTSKRASMLFSDVAGASSNFLGSLTGALTPSTPTNPATSRGSASQQTPANYFPLVAVESPTKRERSSPSPSILDEDNDQLSQVSPRALAPPLVPGKPMAAVATECPASKTDAALSDDEEWNW